MTATSWPMSSCPWMRQVAADHVEQERRHLRQEVVEELDQEFPLVEVVADLEDVPEPGGDIGALVVRGVVDVDRADAVDDLADPARQLARRQLPLAPEHDQPPAHARDDHDLDHGDDDDGDHARARNSGR